jgi:hypothetical protein
MTKYLFILSVFVSIKSKAQFDYVDQSGLYRKFGITKVNAFFHDSGIVENDEIWKIDSKGRIIYNELLPTNDDSNYSAKIWTYKNDSLVTQMDVGVWNIKTNKVDTALTKYFYDISKNLVEEQHTHTKDKDTLTQIYEYSNGLKIKGRLHNNNQEWLYVSDSVAYYPSKVKKLESTTYYYDGNAEYKKEFFFDTLGVLQAAVEYGFEDNCAVPEQLESLIY